MGYIRRDLGVPAMAKWQYSLKFKNTILRHWPTMMIGTTKVFAPLFVYQNGLGIYKTPAHLKIYKLLGMKVSDLEAGQYDGIENTYMSVPGIDLSYDILQTQIRSYIEFNSPQIYPLSKDPFNVDPVASTRLNPDPYRDNAAWLYGADGVALDTTIPEPKWDKDGWITAYLTYEPTVKADVPESIGDAQILGLIESGDRNSIHFEEDEGHPLIFASILDTQNVLFENTARIVQKTIEERTTNTYVLNQGNLSNAGTAVGRYLKTAVVEYKFRRVKDASDPLVAALITKIETEMEALSLKLNTTKWTGVMRTAKQAGTFGSSLNSSVSKQLIRMYHHEVGPAETLLNYNGYLKYDGMATQKAKDFGKIFSKQITQGHTLKKVKFWKKLLVVVITIIAVIVAVILIIFQQYWAAAMVLSFAAGLQMGLAYYWAKHGDPAAANFAMGHAEFLSVCATVVGIWAVLQEGIKQAVIEAAKQAIKEALKDSDFGVLVDIYNAYTGDFKMETMTEMLTTFIKFLNTAFEMYSKIVDPGTEDMKKLSEDLAASNKLVEDTAGAEMLDTIEVEYSDPYNNWIDFNEKMQSMPYMMTAGRNRMLMNRYYVSGF